MTFKTVFVQDGFILTVRMFGVAAVITRVEADLLEEGGRPAIRLLIFLVLIVNINHILDARNDLLVLHRRILRARLVVDDKFVARWLLLSRFGPLSFAITFHFA